MTTMTTFPIETVFQGVIALAFALISALVVPLLKSKLDAVKLDYLYRFVRMAVEAAEQELKAYSGKARFGFVKDQLEDAGFDKDAPGVDTMIESAVFQLHSWMGNDSKDGTDAAFQLHSWMGNDSKDGTDAADAADGAEEVQDENEN